MTTYTEDFNRGSLGTLAPNGATYTNVGGWTIDANQALAPNDADWSALTYDHEFTNPIIEVGIVDVGDINDYWGIVFRYQDQSNFLIVNIAYGSNTMQAFRRELGFDYVIDNHTMGDVNPAIIKVIAVGDSFDFYADNVFVGTSTSSFLSGNTTAGIASFFSSRYDNLVITDGISDVPVEEVIVTPDSGWGYLPIT